MKVSDYPFSNDDAEYNLIKAFLLELEAFPESDNNWDPARMDWWRYASHSGKPVDFFQANAHYWKTDADKVVALFISEYGRDDFFLRVHPDFSDLFPEVMKWGRDVWAKEKRKIGTDVYTFGTQKIEQLLAAGFYEDGHQENVRVYDLAQYDFSYPLKPGFKMMRFSDYGNYASKAKLVKDAFNHDEFPESRIHSLQATPTYKADLDLVIVNPEGESVGYCTGWLEEINPKSGYIEPMGVRSDYRKNGFGAALAIECFKRLRSMGADVAWIASHAEPDVSNFLYDSLNPVEVKRAYTYSLNLEN